MTMRFPDAMRMRLNYGHICSFDIHLLSLPKRAELSALFFLVGGLYFAFRFFGLILKYSPRNIFKYIWFPWVENGGANQCFSVFFGFQNSKKPPIYKRSQRFMQFMQKGSPPPLCQEAENH